MFEAVDGPSTVGQLMAEVAVGTRYNRNPRRLRLLLMTTIAIATISAACARTPTTSMDRPEVIPLTGEARMAPAAGASDGGVTATASTNVGRSATADPPTGDLEPDDEDHPDANQSNSVITIARFVAADVLARYDEVVTTLAEDPMAAADADDPVRRLWDQTVVPGSFLHDDVLERMVMEPLTDGTRLVAGPDGVSYRHHVTDITDVGVDAITFAWCGYAPGIRIDRRSGTVVDDYVARMSGVGRVVRRSATTEEASRPAGVDTATSSSWMLEDLDHLDYDILPPGSVDPCVR